MIDNSMITTEDLMRLMRDEVTLEELHEKREQVYREARIRVRVRALVRDYEKIATRKLIVLLRDHSRYAYYYDYDDDQPRARTRSEEWQAVDKALRQVLATREHVPKGKIEKRAARRAKLKAMRGCRKSKNR